MERERNVQMYSSDFKSILPQHPTSLKSCHFETSYHNSYDKEKQNKKYMNVDKSEVKSRKQVDYSNDIQTSLNLNAGMHNIHPKNANDGLFRHLRKDVTINDHRTFLKD